MRVCKGSVTSFFNSFLDAKGDLKLTYIADFNGIFRMDKVSAEVRFRFLAWISRFPRFSVDLLPDKFQS